MLYPRISKVGDAEQLVAENQCVTYREHMTGCHRLLYLTGAITGETSAHDLIMAMDTLSHEPIKLVITSPGGDLDSTFLLYDTFKMVKSPIITIGRYCASGAALLLAAGSERYLSPHAKVMLHLPAGQMGGDARDWDIQHRQMETYRSKVIDLLCECGATKTPEEILVDIDRNFWMEPAEAIEYGLADSVISQEIWAKLTKEA